MHWPRRRARGVLGILALAGLTPGCVVLGDPSSGTVYGQPAIALEHGRVLVAAPVEEPGEPRRLAGAWLSSGLDVLDRWTVTDPSLDPQHTVAAAAGGGRFLIAWGHRYGISGVFADSGGRPSAPLRLVERVAPPAINAASSVSLAFDGSDFVVSWIEWDEKSWDPAVQVARISPAGRVRDPGVVTVHPGSPRDFPEHANRAPLVASSGAGSLIVWGRRKLARLAPMIMAARLDEDGVLLDPGGFVAAEGYDLPAVAWDQDTYFVLRQAGQTLDGEYRPGALEPTSLGGLRVSPDGLVDPEAFSIPTDWTCFSQGAAAGAGMRLAVWSELDRVRAMLVSRTGTLTSGPIEIGVGNRSVVAAAGPSFAIAWNDTLFTGTEAPRFEHSRIWVRALAGDGALGPARRIWP